MQTRDLWRIVIGAKQPPPCGSRHSEDFWQRKSEARAFILDSLNDSLVISVGAKQFAYEIYEYLDQTYEAKNWGNLVTMREEFIALKYQDGQDRTAHINRLKTIGDKLSRQDKAVDDKELVCQLLTSLPDLWSQFKSVYFTQDRPLP